jgi:hypothetical protein
MTIRSKHTLFAAAIVVGGLGAVVMQLLRDPLPHLLARRSALMGAAP